MPASHSEEYGKMVLLLVVLMCFCAGSQCYDGKEDRKRILVNDPNYILNHELQDMKTTIQTLQADVNKLKTANAQLQTALQTGGGSVYVRWGHMNCTSHSEMVYSGFAGGSWYAGGSGGSSNYLCLPRDPEYGKHSDAKSGSEGRVYGAEYNSDFYASQRGDRDVPCAVCRIQNSATIMIPGKVTCYAGWRREYHGYLANGGHGTSYATSEFVCVDQAVDTLIHSQANENGRLFNMVESRCGSLSCPPYVDGREMTCVVCSK